MARSYVGVLNRIIAAKPADLTLTMHICRGNFRSTWFSSGGYEPIAEILFANCPVDGFFLEYDSERSGGFEPLRFIKDQTVVLGLITSKFPNSRTRRPSRPASPKQRSTFRSYSSVSLRSAASPRPRKATS